MAAASKPAMALECKTKTYTLTAHQCAGVDITVVDERFMEMSPKVCVGPSKTWTVYLSSPHVLHVKSSDERVCLNADIVRVAKCYKNCEFGDLRYCFPATCPFTYLPAGHYEITVPEQGAVPMAAGDKVEVSLVLEPVGTDFYDYLSILNGRDRTERC